jgi:hypothetical protein
MDDNQRALQAQLLGLTAAVTLMADLHLNQAALRAAMPMAAETLRNHNLFSTQPDWVGQIALDQFAAVLRTPASS